MSFVIAAFVVLLALSGAVLPAMDFRRRGYQLALAFAVFLFAGGLASAIFPVDDAYTAISLSRVSGGGGDDAAVAIRHQRTLFLGLGLFMAILGLVMAGRWPTTYLAVLVAGVLVLAEGVIDPGSSGTLYDTSGDAGTTANAIYAVVTGLGSAILLAYGTRRYDGNNSPRD